HDVANVRAETPGYDTGIRQIAEAHRDVEVFRDQVEKCVRDVQVDADPRVGMQEPGEELQERVVAQHDRDRDSQQPFGFLLCPGEHALCLLQQAQRLLAFVEVFASWRGEAHAPGRAPEQRYAELR